MDELNIVLDDELYQFITNHGKQSGLIILFLELITEGKLSSDIFSHSFIKKRSESLKISIKEYEKDIIKPLKPLFQHKYKKLNIWMTPGMNTGMSLLLLLAYLDQIQDHNQITIYLYDEKMRKIKSYHISADGYYKIYQTVLLKHQKPKEITISPIQQAITYFFEYISENNPMKQFICANDSLEPQILYIKFMGKFSAYHLSDLQFIRLLHEVKTNKNR